MKIKFCGYNAFLIESGDKKIAIDPGALFMYWFRFTTVISNNIETARQTRREYAGFNTGLSGEAIDLYTQCK